LRIACLVLSGVVCGCNGFLPASGPTTRGVVGAETEQGVVNIQVVEVTDNVARRLTDRCREKLFSELLTAPQDRSFKVGAGDVLGVSLWEAPPATLFDVSVGDIHSADLSSAPSTSRHSAFPEQMVNSEGTITIPFIGPVKAAGRTLQQIGTAIEKGLQGKANQPQVVVQMVKNTSSNVTIVGEVGASTRMPLTPMGERLLDALAAAGGVRQPVNKLTLEVTRGNKVYALPLETIIRDPRQNIVLQPGDVITALYMPLSFTALGATGKNEEINFEAQGISLAQALARSGGLQDSRADAHGVFIFRFEGADALDWPNKPVATTPDNLVPVVYRINLRDPASFLVAQNFPINNKDVLFVSNAPASELQKFLNLVYTLAYPAVTAIPLAK
jgi:polysaccharide export outer membrane protein